MPSTWGAVSSWASAVAPRRAGAEHSSSIATMGVEACTDKSPGVHWDAVDKKVIGPIFDVRTQACQAAASTWCMAWRSERVAMEAAALGHTWEHTPQPQQAVSSTRALPSLGSR